MDKNIDVGYELWDRGYRVNTHNYSEKEFYEFCMNVQRTHDYDVSFDDVFQALLDNHPEYFINEEEEEKAYFAENEPKLRQYFKDHFEGKSWNEIESDEKLYDCWGFYSDWHKDVYGYRPHGIVCGQYINPYRR